jgi:hypothetical protein
VSTTKRNPEGIIIPRERADPEAKLYLRGVGYFAEYEIEEAKQQRTEQFTIHMNAMRNSWEKSQYGRACLELYKKFLEYKKLYETDPLAKICLDGWPVDFPEHMLFVRALRELRLDEEKRTEIARMNLTKARLAARCDYVYMDGSHCGSPRMKGHTLCYKHERMEQVKAVKLDLGPMEDADSIQVAIKKLQVAVIDGTLDGRQVSQLSYLIQLAAWNVRNTTIEKFEEPEDEEEAAEGRRVAAN